MQNIVEFLKRNKIIVMWDDSLWWQTMNLFNSLLEYNVWLTNLKCSPESVCTYAFIKQRNWKNILITFLFLISRTSTVFFLRKNPHAKKKIEIWTPGGALNPHFGRYMCRGKVKMRAYGAGSSVKWGLRSWLVGRVWLALWPVVNPGALTDCFAFGLAAVNRPWAAINGFRERNEI